VIRHAHCPVLVVRREGEEVVEAHSGLMVHSGGDVNLGGGRLLDGGVSSIPAPLSEQ
jgi:hypothetical protein